MLAPSRIMRTTPEQTGGGRHRASLVAKAREAIEEGSRSFAAASRLFDRTTRERVWLLYAWCRRCDDIADAQDKGGALGDQSDAAKRLRSIKLLTNRAFDRMPTADVAFDAFGQVAIETGITHEMAEDVIAGFALDAEDWRPRTEKDMMQYCYHVAGAVGVMMGVVMGVAKTDEEMLDRACDLGLAFQLNNIARDIEEDDAAGRCYLPLEWLSEADIPPGQHMKPMFRAELVALVARMLDIAETHEAASRLGARNLPFRSRWAVLSAARIYGAIGRKVRKSGTAAWDHRIYISGPAKARHVAAAYFEALLNRPKAPTEMPRWSRRDFARPAVAALTPLEE
ncbi:phytoene/squalene synthase family protein [Allopontixanthobacter sediminis]|uniref:Phytoene/squalene synthase family protein n=1 Tax=Allopontixanthobacter sediminis TaxID=1689985 RepID=A0A845B816_9SPHN|nr:phytoene/squalene synthase family protein [Allopontixanthobacter sediminis]MXP45602.1 phytoene/squalene synthase family protein [Allopontixanthobacter sediminis]